MDRELVSWMPCMAVAGGQVGGAGSLASIHILALGKLCSRVSQVLEQRTQPVCQVLPSLRRKNPTLRGPQSSSRLLSSPGRGARLPNARQG